MAECTCRICGSPFASARSSAVICSFECRRVASRQASREYARRNGAGGSLKHRRLTCVGCGVEFEGVFGGRKSYCTEKCRIQTLDRRRSAKQAAAGPGEATCSSCGINVPGRAKVDRKCQSCKKDQRGDRTEYERRRSLSRYGLTPERYAEMFAEQGGRCAICRTADPGVKGLAVDHCHTSGDVRGLLCGKCNTLLGLADEDPRIFIQAMHYVGAHVSGATWWQAPRASRWQSAARHSDEPGCSPDEFQLRLAI